jgi:serine/threonine-protein kinase
MVRRVLVVGLFVACALVGCWQALVHTVHRGTRSVPDLTGQSVEQATRDAHDIGLLVELEEPGVFSGDVEIGAIAEQQPRPGFHVKTGSRIRVRASLGSERAAIPDLRGESVQGSVRGLERAGLVPGERSRVDGMTAADRVIATDPPIGTLASPGSEVHVLVNQSPANRLYVMPSLLSRTTEEARRFCLANRLRLGQIHEVPYPGLPPGVLLRQYPPEGSPVSRADIVAIWVVQ